MNVTITDNKNGTQTVRAEVPLEKVTPYLEKAGTRLTHKHAIPGFRPGKATLDAVIKFFGEAAVWDEAVQDIVASELSAVVKEKSLAIVGRPDITVEKLAPGNPVIFSAVVSMMPTVTFSNWRTVHVTKKDTPVTEADVDAMLLELRELQAKEALVTRPAAKGDRVEVDFEVKRNGAVIEGGKGTKYPLVIGKQTMIPGFEDQLIGMKTGDSKTFTLRFPKPYGNEALAGEEAEFAVTMQSVFERTLPEATDEWAQVAFNKPVTELRSALTENLKTERRFDERRRVEHELMQALVKAGTFSALPDVLINAEIQKMISELQYDVTARGMKWDQYLQGMKKTVEELQTDMKPAAEERVKGALVLRTLSDELNVAVSDEELNAEIDRHRKRHDEEHAHAHAAGQAHDHGHHHDETFDRPEFKEYIRRVLSNRATVEKLVELLVQ